MAHRGRLNVLAHIMQKPYYQIFSEFEGKEYEDEHLLGDVKYHLGFSTEIQTDDGSPVHLTMCPNPSHLETVDPVVEGLTRAFIDKMYRGTPIGSLQCSSMGMLRYPDKGLSMNSYKCRNSKGIRQAGLSTW